MELSFVPITTKDGNGNLHLHGYQRRPCIRFINGMTVI